ncbi:hypothetical protein Poli38472_010961 [Pythium oligandrum]|uniref:Uncharacterized protein n=1 Tax=Pythium oligandrum TaxID=41045 RepID=A0A8K1CG40_PYTOL|nr:hypothetical protein Poli38472_010961 [Pythium oligandrum]|eukprot:TMW61898.1 hypothetical protein Poli38472_010961 [Pythium oligandrum]
MKLHVALLILLTSSPSTATPHGTLSTALPKNVDISDITPLFDFDTDSCYPSSAFNSQGELNKGLRLTGGVASGCRPTNFLDSSNTYHRYACLKTADNTSYCGHMFALYFEKDQVMPLFSILGHRHDFEHAIVWTTNGNVTHGSASTHGRSRTKRARKIPREGQHLKFVYHKASVLTHSMRFAMKHDVEAENSYGRFVLPSVVSWYTMHGNVSLDNEKMRTLVDHSTFGDAHHPELEGDFVRNLNKARPFDYPIFAEESKRSSE